MSRFTDKVVVVTGGTTGIGYTTAQQFQNEGAQVVITGQNAERVQSAAESLGNGAVGVVANAANLSDIDALFADVKSRFGRVDVLFVNAGVTWVAPLLQVDESHFDQQMDINFKGAFFTIQRAVPLMGQGGTIIVNTSIFDKIGNPGVSIYSASKAALRSLVRTLGAELTPQGIRINAVSPGPIETPILSKVGMPQEQLDAFAEQLIGNVPLGRFGQPEEIAKAVLFLASEDSSYVLGEELVVDGGWTSI